MLLCCYLNNKNACLKHQRKIPFKRHLRAWSWLASWWKHALAASLGILPIHTLALPSCPTAGWDSVLLHWMSKGSHLLECWRVCRSAGIQNPSWTILISALYSSEHEPEWICSDSHQGERSYVFVNGSTLATGINLSFLASCLAGLSLETICSLLLSLEAKDCNSKSPFKPKVILWGKWDAWISLFVLYHPLWNPFMDLLWFLFSFWVFSLWPWVRDNIKCNVFYWVYFWANGEQ